jgi:hypothetical protein
LRPFSQIALLVARSHERSQFAIRKAAPLWSSHIHVGSKRAMYLQLSMRSAPTLEARRAAEAPARTWRARSIARGTRTLSSLVARRSSLVVGSERADASSLGIARSNARASRRRCSRRAALRTTSLRAARNADFEPGIAAPRRAIRPSAGVARSPGRRPDGAAGTSGAQGTSDPLSPTPAPQRGGHYGLGTRVVLGSILPATVTDDEDPAVYPAGGPDRQWPS